MTTHTKTRRLKELYSDLEEANDLASRATTKPLKKAYRNLETIILNTIMALERTI